MSIVFEEPENLKDLFSQTDDVYEQIREAIESFKDKLINSLENMLESTDKWKTVEEWLDGIHEYANSNNCRIGKEVHTTLDTARAVENEIIDTKKRIIDVCKNYINKMPLPRQATIGLHKNLADLKRGARY